MRPTISTAHFPTLRRARFSDQEAAEYDRDQRLLAERRAALACRKFGIDPSMLRPVSITSRATCEADVVLL